MSYQLERLIVRFDHLQAQHANGGGYPLLAGPVVGLVVDLRSVRTDESGHTGESNTDAVRSARFGDGRRGIHGG